MMKNILTLIFLVAIEITMATSSDTRFSFLIGVPMMIIYFALGLWQYKKGNLIKPDYTKFLGVNKNSEVTIK